MPIEDAPKTATEDVAHKDDEKQVHTANGDLETQVLDNLGYKRANVVISLLKKQAKEDGKDVALHNALRANQAAIANAKDHTALQDALQDLPSPEIAQRARVLQDLSKISNDDEEVVKALFQGPANVDLKSIARRFNAKDLAEAVRAATDQQEHVTVNGEGQPSSNRVVSRDPNETEGPSRDAMRIGRKVRRNLFNAERTLVLRKMVEDGEIPMELENDQEGRAATLSIFDSRADNVLQFTPSFGILRSRKLETTESGLQAEQRALKTMARIQNLQKLTMDPEAIPAAMKAGFSSAKQIASIPFAQFIRNVQPHFNDPDLTPDDNSRSAEHMHRRAQDVAFHANHSLTTALQALRGTGIRAIDGSNWTRGLPPKTPVAILSGLKQPINIRQLFGSIDYCECADCNSVLSPAAYFVELLQFLRNNNLKDTYEPGWEGTALEMLLLRRPDLAKLELTCANANTILPYIDLSNEIMESFIVHRHAYAANTHLPKEATLDVFNVDDNSVSSELLAQPQNVNYHAYCVLNDAVYPFVLPYSQPLDEIRIFLGHLEITRLQLLDIFRPSTRTLSSYLAKIENETRARALAAETLLLSQNDFKLLTKEVFYPNHYLAHMEGRPLNTDEIAQRLHIAPVHAYWGYDSEADMLSTDETLQVGLTFVEKQFLPHSGITYADLVQLLRTAYINPNFPNGWALLLLQRIRFSYKYLQTLVDEGAVDKYGRLVAFLTRAQPIAELFGALRKQYLKSLPNQANNLSIEDLFRIPNGLLCSCNCSCDAEAVWRHWVEKYFALVGELLVLDSRDEAVFEVEGWLILHRDQPEPETPRLTLAAIEGVRADDSVATAGDIPYGDQEIGYLHRDGSITVTAFDGSETEIGHVTPEGRAVDQDQTWLSVKYHLDDPLIYLHLWNISKTKAIGDVRDKTSMIEIWEKERPAQWGPIQETCNISRVRLVRLNGSPPKVEDFDRMHRFVRLWRRLGWSIDDVDQSLSGLANITDEKDCTDDSDTSSDTSASSSSAEGNTKLTPLISWDDLNDECGRTQGVGEAWNGSTGGSSCCSLHDGDSWQPRNPTTISAAFIKQLAAVKAIVDRTSLELPKLLSFWADIPTHGQPKSLYERLFRTRDLAALDPVFAADANGNYLSSNRPTKLQAHLPVLMAAFRVPKLEDMTDIIALAGLSSDTDLTVHSLSSLYRWVLLAQVFGIKLSYLRGFRDVFGDPFIGGATHMLQLLKDWDKLSDSSFSLAQLCYIIADGELDPVRPIRISEIQILRTLKQLSDGLDNIERTYPDPAAASDTKSDAVAGLLAMVFDAKTAKETGDLLQGTSSWTVDAPTGRAISVPATFSKFEYSMDPGDPTRPASASIRMRGILTAEEIDRAKALVPADQAWSYAIDKLMKQPQLWLQNTLAGILAKADNPQAVLLAGDEPTISPRPTEAEPTPAPILGTSPGKTAFFLKYFMPYLRDTLSVRLIVATVSAVIGTTEDITTILLSDILTVGNTSALTILKGFRKSPALISSSTWKGYLLSPSTDAYTFFIASNGSPGTVSLDGAAIAFQPQEDSKLWVSQPITLQSGRLYRLLLDAVPVARLTWKTSKGAKSAIPETSLLPDVLSGDLQQVFAKSSKAGLVVTGFTLTLPELVYVAGNPGNFANVDFNELTLPMWMRLQSYSSLRDALQSPEIPLVDLFRWASSRSADPAQLLAKIIHTTRWDREAPLLTTLLQPSAFGLGISDFRNELALVKLKDAIDLAKKLNIAVPELFGLAKPVRKFWNMHADAIILRKALRSRYTVADWEQLARPLNNTLRENQKNALIAYILAMKPVADQNITDADALFEFFLIDVQMSSCLQTSRIKQAISSVQQFVQRCLLGLEVLPIGENNKTIQIDAQRWEWMSRHQVFSAARQVFLWKENVLFPNLRDDKSPFFKDFESELLQKDVDTESVALAIRNYLFKLDEVANLQAVGIFDDDFRFSDQERTTPRTIHIISRTWSAPFMYFYRQLDVEHMIWMPWEKMTADIPNYIDESWDKAKTETENPPTVLNSENGTYVIPVVWYDRIFAFFPQITKKTVPVSGGKVADTTKTTSSDTVKAKETWEVKMCFVERRKGAWTSKVISADSITEDIANPDTYDKPAISDFAFIPRIFAQGASTTLAIDVLCRVRTLASAPSTAAICIGRYEFTNGRLVKAGTRPDNLSLPAAGNARFGYLNIPAEGFFTTSEKQLHSWQSKSSTGAPDIYAADDYPYITHFRDTNGPMVMLYLNKTLKVKLTHDFVHEALGKLSATDDLSGLYNYLGNLPSSNEKAAVFGADARAIYHELSAPLAIYNWELMLYIPWALLENYHEKKQLSKAIGACNLILDFMTSSANPSDSWKFLPFREVVARDDLDSFFQSLLPNTESREISEWRDNPFSPFPLARSHPLAFMKAIVMKYIQLFIDYGDYYFRQNTLEALPQAIQCYVQASHVFGASGQKIPKRGKTEPQTYQRLLERFDAFDDASVDLELEFPFSNQIGTVVPIGFSNHLDTPVNLATLFGSETSRYFCIPNNPHLQALRDTIDDRLYKIRHCQDINGVIQQLPLWEPAIDPALLVQATAAGLSIDSVLNDLSSPMPNYRFFYLLQKAHEVCNDLKNFLAGFLTAKEKRDAEALGNLRQRHEVNMNELYMSIKTAQLDEANQSLAILQQNRLATEYRMRHYLKLLGEDLAKIPADAAASFAEIELTYEKLSDDSGLKLTDNEKWEQYLAAGAALLNAGAGVVEAVAAATYVAPNVSAVAAPYGCGASAEEGGSHGGNAAQAVARGIRTLADLSNAASAHVARRTGLLRAMQERVYTANAAGYEIKSIDAQILAQKIRIDVAGKEISNHQQSIDNSRDVQDFLSSKYTNEQLYTYLETMSRQLCRRSYDLAYELAKKAEKVYHFERPSESSRQFINYGYWEPSHDGLLAGDALDLDLRQMESTYQNTRGHDFEITKSVSLRLIAPMQLMQLRETGKCEFSIPEILYDIDFPGHYLRRIKTVSLSMPCIVGPYTGVNATLRLLEHKFRNTSLANSSSSYRETTDGDSVDPRFSSSSVPISSIATSNAQGDPGVFELSLKDERFLPFEGAGAISRWSLSLPAPNGPKSTALRASDYSTITDVILTIRYTALDGGDKLSSVAAGAVRAFAQELQEESATGGLFVILDLRAEFATEWARFVAPPATPESDRVLRMLNVQDRLPVLARGAKKVSASDIWLYSTAELPVSTLSIEPVAKTIGPLAGMGSEPITFTEGDGVGNLHKYTAAGNDVEMTGAWDLKVKAPDAANLKLGDRGQGAWIVVRYHLKL